MHLEDQITGATDIYEYGRYGSDGNLRKRPQGRYADEVLCTAWHMRTGAATKSKVIQEMVNWTAGEAWSFTGMNCHKLA